MRCRAQGVGRIIALWCALLLAGAAIPAVAAPTHQVGLLWKIEANGVAPSYLYGTIHLGDQRVMHLSPPVREAFDHASVFVMEVVMDYAAYGEIMRGMFFTDGRNLRDYLGDELFKRVVAVMRSRGFKEDTVVHMKPWAVMSVAGLPNVGNGAVLDLQLYTDAVHQHKQVHGLETPQEQLGVFDKLSKAAQVAMVRSTVEDAEDNSSALNALLAAYLKRDLTALAKVAERDDAQRYPALSREFVGRVIDDRNLRMAKRMQPYLRQGNAFIAVGALHLPGEHGLIRLLEQRGYRVTPVW